MSIFDDADLSPMGIYELDIVEPNELGMAELLGGIQCRLLIVDGDDDHRSHLQRRLQMDGCVVDDAPDIDTAKQMLHAQTYDLILLDLLMHPLPGYELFEYLKEDPTLKWIPLIVLSGSNNLNEKLRCFKLGADDYVTRPIQYEELAARIYSLLKRSRNFEQLAFRDPLTGTNNRRYFDHQIRLELKRIERYPAPISLAFIDIDKFKSINDTYGHHAGDLVLQGFAHMLQTNIRTTDLLARFGGEEFIVVLPGSTEEQGIRFIQMILDQANSQPVAHNEGQPFSITFSAGVAQWQPGMPIEEWLRITDAAMYQAKQEGRNRVLGAYNGHTRTDAKAGYTPPIHDKKKLLLVDDDFILRSIVASQLKHLPIDVIQASDAEEAFQILREVSIDICILESAMPKIDGLSLMDVVKANPNYSQKGVKILMLSGKKKDDALKDLELGANDYLTKPFSLVELEMRIQKMLK